MRTLNVIAGIALSLISATALAGSSAKVPTAVKQELRAALTATPSYQNAVRPSFRYSINKSMSDQVTASATLMGMGHDGPIFTGQSLPTRISLATALAPYDANAQKLTGPIQTSPIFRALNAR
jgi:hypothetical protein